MHSYAFFDFQLPLEYKRCPIQRKNIPKLKSWLS